MNRTKENAISQSQNQIPEPTETHEPEGKGQPKRKTNQFAYTHILGETSKTLEAKET